ncbi:RNA-binding protein [Bacteriovoracaceae bacterium]|nr:RNA-binding protein [Bacteriovoracaceae bacterium]|tara:strand:- start:81923 stop:82351 length:429 start_codon:yes stop_codon:yes gene_type:complete
MLEANKSQEVTVYIGNLNYKRDEKGIMNLFSRYGTVGNISIAKESGSEKKKGYAFVTMSEEEAQLAIKGLNGALIDGRTIKCSQAQEREEFKNFKQKRTINPAKGLKASSNVKEEELEVPKKPIRKKKQKGLNELFEYLQSK